VIAYRFATEDLGRVRFAISPLFEIAASLDVLRAPARHAMHAPWAAQAAARVGDLDLAMLDAVVPERGYRPDFVNPPPARPRAALADELERVRATPPARVATELGWAHEGRRMPPAARALIDDPGAALDRLVEVMSAYWDAAIAPFWDRILATLEADIAYRAGRLAEGGPLTAFADLHPSAAYRAGAIEVDRPYDAAVELGGRGLLLVPAVFVWPDLWAMIDPPWQPAVIYAPRGVAALWAPAEAEPEALADLLGRRRARILRALDAPASTQELSRRLEASPGGVSEHLGVLRRAGLVAGRRDGRAVRYARTPAGESLVRAASGRG
jgi:DNA-binding transcriptional ArsR family regulator